MLLFLSPWSHQFPLPIYFMAVLVQLDSSDVEKCAGGGMSRQPGARMEDLLGLSLPAAWLAAFGVT